LDEIGVPDDALEKELERELLSRGPGPAKPVGLRYNRLEREGSAQVEYEMTPWLFSDVVPKPDEDIAPRSSREAAPESSTGASSVSSEASYWYSLCNSLLISRVLAQCKKILVACGESWPGSLFRCEDKEVVRICLSSFVSPFVSPVREGIIIPVETYEQFSYGDSSFDGVIVDSSILLSKDVKTALREFSRVLKPGGRICILAVNWEYEMASESETYETSFRRYRGKVYLGLLKRTLNPPREVEYICLLDPGQSLAQKLASMERDELRALTLSDAPDAAKAVISAEVIEIPQFTRTFLEDVCREAGFSSVAVSGAPGILASRLFKGFVMPGSTLTPGSTAMSALTPFGAPHALMNEISQSLALAFPFITLVDNPHIIAVCAS
jgi:SAM-dependent methyltransferase